MPERPRTPPRPTRTSRPGSPGAGAGTGSSLRRGGSRLLQVARHVPGPELDNVAVRVGDVRGPVVAVPVELVHLGFVPVAAQALEGGLELLAGEVQREVHVQPAPPAGEADLRRPQPDPRARARHHPDRLPLFPALDDREPKCGGVEAFGRLEVDDLEHELADTGYRDSHPNRRTTRRC